MATLKTNFSSLVVFGALAAVTTVTAGSRVASPKAQADTATVQPVAQPQCGGDTKTDTKKPTS